MQFRVTCFYFQHLGSEVLQEGLVINQGCGCRHNGTTCLSFGGLNAASPQSSREGRRAVCFINTYEVCLSDTS